MGDATPMLHQRQVQLKDMRAFVGAVRLLVDGRDSGVRAMMNVADDMGIHILVQREPPSVEVYQDCFLLATLYGEAAIGAIDNAEALAREDLPLCAERLDLTTNEVLTAFCAWSLINHTLQSQGINDGIV